MIGCSRSRNASMLSLYYMSQDNYLTARHLQSGASHVIEEWRRKFDQEPEINPEVAEKVVQLVGLFVSQYVIC